MTTITVTYDIPEKLIRDIIITACEGGIGYWSQLQTYDGPAIEDGPTKDDPKGGLPLRIREIEEEEWNGETAVYGPWRDLGIDEVVKGLQKMIQEWPESPCTQRMMAAIANYDSGNYDYDAGDADCVIQYAILGEVVYG
jgi:hypothetical protein